MSEQTPDWDGAEVEMVVTARFKYKVNAESYGGVKTLEEALAIDMANFSEDPVGLLGLEIEYGDNEIEFSATLGKAE